MRKRKQNIVGYYVPDEVAETCRRCHMLKTRCRGVPRAVPAVAGGVAAMQWRSGTEYRTSRVVAAVRAADTVAAAAAAGGGGGTEHDCNRCSCYQSTSTTTTVSPVG